MVYVADLLVAQRGSRQLVADLLWEVGVKYFGRYCPGCVATRWWIPGSEGARSCRGSAVTSRRWSRDPLRLWSGWPCSIVRGIYSRSKSIVLRWVIASTLIMIIITRRCLICLWCWRRVSESLHEFTRFTQWMQNSARRPPTFGPSWRTWAIGPPVGCYETTSTVIIYYYSARNDCHSVWWSSASNFGSQEFPPPKKKQIWFCEQSKLQTEGFHCTEKVEEWIGLPWISAKHGRGSQRMS